MLTKDKMIAALNAVADQVEAMCQEHENQEHGGEMCGANRVSAVGFLAHRLGMQPGFASEAAFGLMLMEYAEHCPGCNGHKESSS